jgi:hypothetical protein
MKDLCSISHCIVISNFWNKNLIISYHDWTLKICVYPYLPRIKNSELKPDWLFEKRENVIGVS